MVPTLLPGDRLLVVAGLGPLRPPIRPGDLVALTDPRDPGRVMVKRVAGLDGARIVVRGGLGLVVVRLALQEAPPGSSAIWERSTRCADNPSPTSCCRGR